jgi:hypothetical protein
MQALEIICHEFLANLEYKYLKNINLRNTLRGAKEANLLMKSIGGTLTGEIGGTFMFLFSPRSSIYIARPAIFFCSAARVHRSAFFSVSQPKIDMSSCAVVPFSAAIAAPVLRSPCDVQ